MGILNNISVLLSLFHLKQGCSLNCFKNTYWLLLHSQELCHSALKMSENLVFTSNTSLKWMRDKEQPDSQCERIKLKVKG